MVLKEGTVVSYERQTDSITFQLDPAFITPPPIEEGEEGEQDDMNTNPPEIDTEYSVQRADMSEIRIIHRASTNNSSS